MIVHKLGLFIAVLLCLSAHVFGDVVYSTKAMAPSHRLELRRAIAECRAKVRNSPDGETRSRFQEELCKKLIQAEEYDEALAVAREVMNCPSADAERRAVHHFLVAQIYAMRMEASPSLELMEENRRLALKTAQEVVARRYPEKWLVGESARQLIRSLNDEKHLQEVRGWVQKRQNDPAFFAKLRMAQTQTALLERGVRVGPSGRGASSNSSSANSSLALTRGTASVSYSRASAETSLHSSSGTPPEPRPTHSRTFLRGPIVIDGSRVHTLAKSAPAVGVLPSPYAPGAEPQVSPSLPAAMREPASR